MSIINQVTQSIKCKKIYSDKLIQFHLQKFSEKIHQNKFSEEKNTQYIQVITLFNKVNFQKLK